MNDVSKWVVAFFVLSVSVVAPTRGLGADALLPSAKVKIGEILGEILKKRSRSQSTPLDSLVLSERLSSFVLDEDFRSLLSQCIVQVYESLRGESVSRDSVSRDSVSRDSASRDSIFCSDPDLLRELEEFLGKRELGLNTVPRAGPGTRKRSRRHLGISEAELTPQKPRSEVDLEFSRRQNDQIQSALDEILNTSWGWPFTGETSGKVNEKLKRLPDFSGAPSETFALSHFSHRTKQIAEGAYSTVFKTRLRFNPSQVSLKNEMEGITVALKITPLDYLRRDQSFQSLVLLSQLGSSRWNMTDYFPVVYGFSIQRGYGVSSNGRFLWTEMEWVDQTLDAYLRLSPQVQQAAVLSDSVIFEILYGEWAARKSGLCIGDWKLSNVGLKRVDFQRVYSIEDKKYYFSSPWMPKRIDLGELHFLSGGGDSSRCHIDLSQVIAQSQSVNQMLRHVGDLNDLRELERLMIHDFPVAFKPYLHPRFQGLLEHGYLPLADE